MRTGAGRVRTSPAFSTRISPRAHHRVRWLTRVATCTTPADGSSATLLTATPRCWGWRCWKPTGRLCEIGDATARHWLLRNACEGTYLDGYYAGKFATATHLHEAITGSDCDDLVDHTSHVLKAMTDCDGMGMTLADYPPALMVLAAHVDHLSRQEPTAHRYLAAALVAYNLLEGNQDHWVSRYRAVLSGQDWGAAVSSRLTTDARWFTESVGPRLDD